MGLDQPEGCRCQCPAHRHHVRNLQALVFDDGSQTCLTLHDKTANFSTTSDGLIDNIIGFNGNLTNLAIV